MICPIMIAAFVKELAIDGPVLVELSELEGEDDDVVGVKFT